MLNRIKACQVDKIIREIKVPIKHYNIICWY